MQRKLVILTLAALLALVSTAPATASDAQDAERTVSLSPGCSMTTLTFPDGTDAATVAAALSPPDALDSIWRLDNSSGSFHAFMPQAPQASDLTSVSLLDAVFICVSTGADIAMPSLSPDPAGTPISTDLGSGCNTVGLTFPDATAPSQLADALTPTDALQSIWRLDSASGSFQAYVAAAPQASDLASLQFLDAVFVCTGGPASLEMPAVTEPAAGGVTGPPGDVRYVMEAAVPQIVDLPPEFVAIDEDFDSFEPPDPLYYYAIYYGSVLSIIGAPPGEPVFVGFELDIFDTVKNARSAMNWFTSLSAEELKEVLELLYGGSFGLKVDSVTIKEREAPAVGEEADCRRFSVWVRPTGTQASILLTSDVITIRRDRVIGQVWVDWSELGPGRPVFAEKLAKKMDAGIQEALPEFLAAVP